MGFKGMGGPEMVGQLHEKRVAERHNQQEAIIDQISKADVNQLMEIQKNTAERVGENPELFEDPDFNRIANAIFRRAQELLGVDNIEKRDSKEILH